MVVDNEPPIPISHPAPIRDPQLPVQSATFGLLIVPLIVISSDNPVGMKEYQTSVAGDAIFCPLP